MNLLVTGGAGFIGSNFARYWAVRAPRRPRRRPRPAHLRRQPREPRRHRAARSRSSRATSATSTWPRSLLREHAHRHRRELRGRVAQQPRDRRSRPLLPHQRARHPDPARGGDVGSASAASTTSRPARSTATSPSTATSCSPRSRPTGRARPTTRRRPAATTRCAPTTRRSASRHDHELRQQLRAVPVPREGHPAVHHARARRPAAAAVRVDPEPAGVDPRARPLHRDRRGARAGHGGRDVPRRAPASRRAIEEIADSVLAALGKPRST